MIWYMRANCKQLQPPIMPRPDLAKLGINYRRIPVLSIGQDVYLDTRLIIQKLEQLEVSNPKLGADGPERKAIEKLLEIFAVDGGIFSRAAQLLPSDLPMLKDPAFGKDRIDFNNGRRWSRDDWTVVKPEAINEIRNAMEFLETTLLADGRDWILKTDQPSLADIEGVWPLHWIAGIPGALPPDQVSAERFPKVYAWINRFQKAVSAAKKSQPKPLDISGDKARELILNSGYSDPDGQVDPSDPLTRAHNLKRGEPVTVWPTDTGSSHRDVGLLVSLDGKEVVYETQPDTSPKQGVRVHAPRHGFRISHADRVSSLKL